MKYFATFVLLLAAALPPRTAAQIADPQAPRTSPAAFGYSGSSGAIPIYNGPSSSAGYYADSAGNFYSDPYSAYNGYNTFNSYHGKQSSGSMNPNCDHSTASGQSAFQQEQAKAAFQSQYAQQGDYHFQQQNQQLKAAGQHPLLILPDINDRSGRQIFQQPLPLTELTYSRKEMERVYGPNFSPPIFTVAKRQPHALQGFDTRFLSPQQQLQHPLPILRSADMASMRAGAKWQPSTNLFVERPVNLAEYESAINSYRASESQCREKRQYYAQQPNHSPENPYYEQMRYAEEPRSAQGPSPLLRQQSNPEYAYGRGNMFAPHPRETIDGVHQVIGGFAQILPMFASMSGFAR